jgi:hypothetical protein
VAKKPNVPEKERSVSAEVPVAAIDARPRKGARRKSMAKPGSIARKRTAAEKEPAPQQALEPGDAEIRLRAYFISERRHRLGLPGDSNSDWLEAKRQLLSEIGPK